MTDGGVRFRRERVVTDLRKIDNDFNHQTTIGAMVALLPASTKSASAAGVVADGSNRR
jgi:hypothetical protein